MKFLMISGYAESLLRFRGDLIMAVAKKGHEICLSAPKIKENNLIVNFMIENNIKGFDFPMERTGMNPIRDIVSFYHLYRLIKKEQPDIVFAYTVKPVIYGMIAARLAGVPARFSLISGLGHAFSEGASDFLNSLVRILYKISISLSSKIFLQNPDDEILLKKYRIISEKNPSIVVNGSGVRIDQYTPVPFPEKINFLLIARLLGSKGVRLYVEAANLIKRSRPDVTFSLVGWIDENPGAITKEELDEWIESGTIKYFGRLDDVRNALGACSVFVLPSFYPEGTPRTILEAMAMGRPVITTDAPGCRETVVDGDNGFLVPVKSVEPLAAAMLKFIEQPELIERMGARSRAIAEEKYDVHKVNAVMLKEMGIE